MYIIKPHSVINQSYYLNFANTINTGMSEIRVLKSLNYYVFCDTIFFLFTAKDKLFNSICDEMDNAKAGFPQSHD